MGGLGRLGLFNEADEARLVASPTPTWVRTQARPSKISRRHQNFSSSSSSSFFFQRQIVTGLVGAKETATAEQIKERLTATLGLSGDKAKAERIFAGVQRFACFCVVCEKQ